VGCLLNSTKRYIVTNAYDYLTSMDITTIFLNCNNVWLKEVPLKVSLFVWCLLLNWIPTKAHFLRREVLITMKSFS